MLRINVNVSSADLSGYSVPADLNEWAGAFMSHLQPPPGDCGNTYLAAFDEGMKQTQAAHDLAVAQGKSESSIRTVTG